MDRQQWFLDRVGKRVFNTLFCNCDICKSDYESGVVICDNFNAIASFNFERDLQAEGTKFKHFDTKEERSIYEAENNLKT
jgi:uncharacterized protein YcsI (UPF0317 family)